MKMEELIDTKQMIRIYHGFFELYYPIDIKRAKESDNNTLTIDLNELLEYDPNLYEHLMNDPKDGYSLIKTTLTHYDDALNKSKIEVKFINMPDEKKIDLNKIRVKDIGKFVKIKGMLKRKSCLIPKLTHIEYLCTNPACPYAKEKIKVPQEDEESILKECPSCKSKIEKLNEIEEDFMQLHIEELAEDLDNSNTVPLTKLVEIKGKLTEPDFINKFLVGSKIEVYGIISKKTKKIHYKKSTMRTIHIEALDLISLEDSIDEIKISNDDIYRIKEISKNPNLMPLLLNSICPDIAGRSEQKEATLYYIVGGTVREDKKPHIHIITIGNASMGKSIILRYLNSFLPKSVYASGENTSKVGLTGGAVIDELSKEWTIEAGAIAYANKGFFLLDEADKMGKNDETNLNEALEHQTITINKIVKGTLSADCPAFVAANPKKGKFNDTQQYMQQISFDPTFLSRFDLVFILDDKDGEKEEELVINKILRLEEEEKTIIQKDILRKYLMYARNLSPTISKENRKKLKKYFITISKASKERNSLDITFRQLYGLTRLCEARAKLHLRDEVIEEDITEVINLMNYTLNKFGISEITTGISNTSRNMSNFIDNFMDAKRDELFTYEEFKTQIKEFKKDISDGEIDKLIDKLKGETIIFEPRKNQYKVLG